MGSPPDGDGRAEVMDLFPEGMPTPPPLPATLTEAQVLEGLLPAVSHVKACSQGRSGSIEVRVVIRGNRRVAEATALGEHAETPFGLCVARAVRHMRFPEFCGPKIELTATFRH